MLNEASIHGATAIVLPANDRSANDRHQCSIIPILGFVTLMSRNLSPARDSRAFLFRCPMQLTAHFTLAEATRSETARERGINNAPTDAELERIRCTATQMEHVRHLLGDNPIMVTSWFRSEALNVAVGGVPTSAHRFGYAVDFLCPEYGSIADVCRAVDASPLQYDQLIWERNTWCHISFHPSLRRENLTYDGHRYTPGLPGE